MIDPEPEQVHSSGVLSTVTSPTTKDARNNSFPSEITDQPSTKPSPDELLEPSHAQLVPDPMAERFRKECRKKPDFVAQQHEKRPAAADTSNLQRTENTRSPNKSPTSPQPCARPDSTPPPPPSGPRRPRAANWVQVRLPNGDESAECAGYIDVNSCELFMQQCAFILNRNFCDFINHREYLGDLLLFRSPGGRWVVQFGVARNIGWDDYYDMYEYDTDPDTYFITPAQAARLFFEFPDHGFPNQQPPDELKPIIDALNLTHAPPQLGVQETERGPSKPLPIAAAGPAASPLNRSESDDSESRAGGHKRDAIRGIFLDALARQKPLPTQAEIARIVGCNPGYVSRCLKGWTDAYHDYMSEDARARYPREA
jgi:hypothetical protein